MFEHYDSEEEELVDIRSAETFNVSGYFQAGQTYNDDQAVSTYERELRAALDDSAPNVSLGGLASGDQERERLTIASLLSAPTGMSSHSYGVLMYYIHRVMEKGLVSVENRSTLTTQHNLLSDAVDNIRGEIDRARRVITDGTSTLRAERDTMHPTQIATRKQEIALRIERTRSKIAALQVQLAQTIKQKEQLLVDVVYGEGIVATSYDELAMATDSWSRFSEAEYLQGGVIAELPLTDDLQPVGNNVLMQTLESRMDFIVLTPSDVITLIKMSPLSLHGSDLFNKLMVRISDASSQVLSYTHEAVLLSSISKAAMQGEISNITTLDRSIMGKAQYQLTPLMMEIANINDLIKLGVNPVYWMRATGRNLSGISILLFETWNSLGRISLTVDDILRVFRASSINTLYSVPRDVVTKSIVDKFTKAGVGKDNLTEKAPTGKAEALTPAATDVTTS